MKAQSLTPGSGARVATLDGLRGLAILLVMIFHQTIVSPRVADNAFDAWFFGLGSSLWFGVDLFFVLSGYLITGILWDSKHTPHYFRNFYMRRTLRIFPLYYAVVFLALVVIPNLPVGIVPADKLMNFGTVKGQGIWYWLYLSNYSIAVHSFRHGILDVSWSLAIEEQFYLLWPTVVLFCNRKALFRVCVFLIVGALAVRIGLALAGANWIVAYVITPARIDLLALGAFIALAARGAGGVETLRPWARRVAPACLLLLGGWFVVHGEFSVRDPLFYTVGFSVIGLFFGSLLVLVLCAPPGSSLARFFSARAMRTLGKYSYALYLFHVPMRALLRDTVYGQDQFPIVLGSEVPGQILFYLAATAITLPVAFASWHLFEKHILELKRYFPTGSR